MKLSVMAAPVCRKCSRMGKPGSKFCSGCGNSFPRATSCSSCGSSSEDGDEFCGKCGSSFAALKCSACGNKVAVNDTFCGVCGADCNGGLQPSPSIMLDVIPSPAPTAFEPGTGNSYQEPKQNTSVDAAEFERKRTADIQKQIGEVRSTNRAAYEKVAFGIDVAFLLDCTESMDDYIAAAKDRLREIATEVRKIDQRARVRIALVGYRDLPPPGGVSTHERHASSIIIIQIVKITISLSYGSLFSFIIEDFVEDEAGFGRLQRRLAAIKAAGGDDCPEDVTGALNKAKELTWASSTRLIVHIGAVPKSVLGPLNLYLLS